MSKDGKGHDSWCTLEIIGKIHPHLVIVHEGRTTCLVSFHNANSTNNSVVDLYHTRPMATALSSSTLAPHKPILKSGSVTNYSCEPVKRVDKNEFTDTDT